MAGSDPWRTAYRGHYCTTGLLVDMRDFRQPTFTTMNCAGCGAPFDPKSRERCAYCGRSREVG